MGGGLFETYEIEEINRAREAVKSITGLIPLSRQPLRRAERVGEPRIVQYKKDFRDCSGFDDPRIFEDGARQIANKKPAGANAYLLGEKIDEAIPGTNGLAHTRTSVVEYFKIQSH